MFNDRYTIRKNDRIIVYVSSDDHTLVSMFADWLSKRHGFNRPVTITEATHRLLRVGLHAWHNQLEKEAQTYEQSAEDKGVTSALKKIAEQGKSQAEGGPPIGREEAEEDYEVDGYDTEEE